ncbi:MAG: outer membrane beta-barrel protein [Rickettsiales bacterium]|nr:outer membrane beta-barrel protein [Rickettsiales bacterium]
MKKVLLTSGIVLMAMVGANAAYPYAALRLGAGLTNADVYNDIADENFDQRGAAGFIGKIAFGAASDFGLRGEIEYGFGELEDEFIVKPAAWRGAEAKADYSVAQNFIMANAYYDITTDTKITPFIGGGVGIGILNTDVEVESRAAGIDAEADSTKTNFVWNVGGGVAYQFNDALTFDVSYRYVDMGKNDIAVRVITTGFDETSITNMDIESHEILVGARYTF